MKVYRLGRTRHSNDLSGEGARLFGGRWNHVMIPCLYTSSTKALAVLEYTVNINIDDIPRALSLVTLEIPDDAIKATTMADLPGDWSAKPAPYSTKEWGSSWLKSAADLAIAVPSVVIPSEWNYLINPIHPGMADCRILEVEDFVYDTRIKIT